jgi:hypothetical protein
MLNGCNSGDIGLYLHCLVSRVGESARVSLEDSSRDITVSGFAQHVFMY